jgi:hypothetical protein
MVALPHSDTRPADELRRLADALGGTTIDPSAWDAAQRIDPRSIAAVAEAIQEAPDAIAVDRISGYTSPESPAWVQLLLIASDPGEPGTPGWDAALDRAAAVIARAIDLHPELGSLASEVSFEL